MVQMEMPFKGISYLKFWQLFCAILLEGGIMRNNCVKLFWIRVSGSGDVI